MCLQFKTSKKNVDKKLYMLTDSNKDIGFKNEVFRSIVLSSNNNNKNYINNSERSNKRKGISLPQNEGRNNKFNLSKIIQKVKNQNSKDKQDNLIKKNKSYFDNSSSIGNEYNDIKNDINEKKKNKDDILRLILFNAKNNSNKNNVMKINNLKNHYLPKLTDHMHNNNSEKNI